jgi:hypothetical protein
LTSGEAFFNGSQIYDPIARLRYSDDLLYVARVGMVASQRFMILTASGEPAWPHEPLGSLSDVGWSLRAHNWQAATIEPVGSTVRPARTLARLLTERA